MFLIIDGFIGIIKMIFSLISGRNRKSVNQMFYGLKAETVTFCSNAAAGPGWPKLYWRIKIYQLNRFVNDWV
jgi:hypothetical protein